nr:MFS transporter [Novosphingobium hassiacum]
MLDGLDLQLGSFAAPLIIREWGLTESQFAPVIAAVMAGMAIGTLVGGWMGDKIGRRAALVASVGVFGAATVLCGFADNLSTLVGLRFVGGLGFGAAFPVGTALLVEWVPRRSASRAIAFLTIGIPVGGLIGATISSVLLPVIGWRNTFIIFGLAPIVYAGILATFLPESPVYLLQRGKRDAVSRLLQKAWRSSMNFGASDAVVGQPDAQGDLAGDVGRWGGVRLNASLWAAFFFQNVITYAIVGWVPVVLVGLSLPLSTAIRGLLVWNLFGIAGSFVASFLIVRRGTRQTMMLLAALGSLSGLLLAAFTFNASPANASFVGVTYVGLALLGIGVGSLQTSLFTLAAHVYDARIRSRGVGIASMFGRLGGVASAFAIGALLSVGSKPSYFMLIGVVFAIVLICAALVNRHVPRIVTASRPR